MARKESPEGMQRHGFRMRCRTQSGPGDNCGKLVVQVFVVVC
jgi:hypothetical protein